MKLTKNLSLVESSVGDSLLLYNTMKEEFYVLNSSAKIIREYYKEKADLIKIEQVIISFFNDIGISNIKEDAELFVKELENKEILIADTNSQSTQNISIKFEANTKEKYETPKIEVLSKEWMIENHPADYYKGNGFGDTWDS